MGTELSLIRLKQLFFAESMKKILSLLGLLILVGIAYKTSAWYKSTADIKAVCDFAIEGKAIALVVEEIDSIESLRYADLKTDNVILVHSPASFGRAACNITYENSEVIVSEYSFAD